ncbi:hypothetical protein BJ912DRAFT_175476 [Pholiota molesta]|nr:hypothetical protein BJ912DRAFT_175476 [Pholiota molesta]
MSFPCSLLSFEYLTLPPSSISEISLLGVAEVSNTEKPSCTPSNALNIDWLFAGYQLPKFEGLRWRTDVGWRGRQSHLRELYQRHHRSRPPVPSRYPPARPAIAVDVEGPSKNPVLPPFLRRHMIITRWTHYTRRSQAQIYVYHPPCPRRSRLPVQKTRHILQRMRRVRRCRRVHIDLGCCLRQCVEQRHHDPGARGTPSQLPRESEPLPLLCPHPQLDCEEYYPPVRFAQKPRQRRLDRSCKGACRARR